MQIVSKRNIVILGWIILIGAGLQCRSLVNLQNRASYRDMVEMYKKKFCDPLVGKEFIFRQDMEKFNSSKTPVEDYPIIKYYGKKLIEKEVSYYGASFSGYVLVMQREYATGQFEKKPKEILKDELVECHDTKRFVYDNYGTPSYVFADKIKIEDQNEHSFFLSGKSRGVEVKIPLGEYRDSRGKTVLTATIKNNTRKPLKLNALSDTMVLVMGKESIKCELIFIDLEHRYPNMVLPGTEAKFDFRVLMDTVRFNLITALTSKLDEKEIRKSIAKQDAIRGMYEIGVLNKKVIELKFGANINKVKRVISL